MSEVYEDYIGNYGVISKQIDNTEINVWISETLIFKAQIVRHDQDSKTEILVLCIEEGWRDGLTDEEIREIGRCIKIIFRKLRHQFDLLLCDDIEMGGQLNFTRP